MKEINEFERWDNLDIKLVDALPSEDVLEEVVLAVGEVMLCNCSSGKPQTCTTQGVKLYNHMQSSMHRYLTVGKDGAVVDHDGLGKLKLPQGVYEIKPWYKFPEKE